MDPVRLGETALKGWRKKVADTAAEPLSARTPLRPEQVRAALGAVFFVLSVVYVARTVATAARALRAR